MDEDRSPNDERDAARSESKSGKDPNNNRTGSASFHSQQSVDHGSSSTFGGHSSVSGPQTSEIRQSRQSRIEYAQMYPSHAYTHREGNSIANASAAGIEMSFEMMVDLASVENYYSLNGGLVLLGYKTALIPVDWNKEADSFQWHFEIMEDSAAGFVQPSLLKATQKEWTKLQHPSQFREARCFIGWFEVAHVMLGTRELLERQEQISWSGSEQCRETLHSEGYEGALQMSFSFAPISLGFQGVKTYSKRSNVRRYTPTDSYRSTLAECRRKFDSAPLPQIL
ncbi:hypothetical protein CGCF415_v005793 [Colletotrichum fructicola]|nr:hypothetical protein CGCF415_v005793 [Colletotrichum fructicola]